MQEAFPGAHDGKPTQKGVLPVSVPPSLVSASDNMSNSVASVGDASSVSASVSSVPSSPQPAPMPAVEYSTAPAVTAVEPQNPFDSVILENSQSGSSEHSGPSLMQTPTRGSATATSPPEQTGLNAPVVNLTASPTPPTNLSTPSRTAPVITTPARNNNNNISTPVQQTTPPPAVLPPVPRTNITNNINTTPQSNQQQQSRMIPVHQQQPPPLPFGSDASTDDDNTAPSSAANTAERMMYHDSEDNNGGVLRQNTGHHKRNSSVTRFLDNTRRRLLTSRKDGESDDEEMDPQSGALIAGYLQKLGRNGKWQTRWFETDGECLSYYKSSKRSKLLATLDLQKVGGTEIANLLV